jgi:hypothetical protein
MTISGKGLRGLLLRNESLRAGWHGIATVKDRMTSGVGALPLALFEWAVPPNHTPPMRALHWVRSNECASGGIRAHSRHPAAYAEVTGYLIPTLIDYAEVELAARCAQWLIKVQATDGSYSDPNQALPYIFDTGQALRGLLATINMLPAASAAAHRAASYLCENVLDGGCGGFDVRYRDTDPLSTHLYVLPPLLQAAEVFAEARWRDVAERCLRHYIDRSDAIQLDTLTHDLGYELEALIDLGRLDLAAPVLGRLCQLQRDDGSLRGVGGQAWVCTPGLSQIAACWYKIGQSQPADLALAWLEKRQLRCGGFFGSYGPDAAYFPDVVPSWAVKFYLDAHRLRCLSSDLNDTVEKSQ